MTCSNGYCIFYEDGDKCMFEEISIDYWGKCSKCKEVKFSEKELKKKRIDALLMLNRNSPIPGLKAFFKD